MSPSSSRTVGELECALLGLFPREDAESWDNPGLTVGDAAALVSGIAVALDVSLANLHTAHSLGCNVLLTHHPVFIEAPTVFTADGSDVRAHRDTSGGSVEQTVSGGLVYEAARLGISLIALHTNLDVSPYVQRVLPDLLGLVYQGPAEPMPTTGLVEGRGGFGQLCSVEPLTLRDLALRCLRVFGTAPRVWGDRDRVLGTVVTMPGSAGSFLDGGAGLPFDCCICGESRYHTSLAVVATGGSIIELGHDVSEYPFVDRLCEVLSDLGCPSGMVHRIDPTTNWWTV